MTADFGSADGGSIPPPAVDAHDLHWLAGLLEGEGSFFPGPPSAPRHPVLQVAMSDKDVVARVGRLFGRSVTSSPPRRDGWQATYVARVTGAKAVAWMMALRPLLGERRRAQIDRALASYDPRPTRRLDDASALEAIALLAGGASVRSVADRFGVSQWCI